MKKVTFTIIMAFAFVMLTAITSNANYDKNYDIRGNTHYYKTAESFSSGSGTEDDPYIITSWEEYNHMQVVGCGDEGIGVHFKLATDLNEHSNFYGDAVRNESIGTKDKPFQGVFDGDGHRAYSYAVLFDVVGENGIVRNLKNTLVRDAIAKINNGFIEDCRGKGDTGEAYVRTSNLGAIAGENTGTIRRCFAKSEKKNPYDIDTKHSGIGGICGFNNGGIIEECYAEITIRVRYGRAVGGIAGDNTGGIIRNCYSRCYLVSEGIEAGGIVGKLNYGTVENCISRSPRTDGHKSSGEIAGAVYGDSKITNCYFSGLMIGNSTIDDAEYGWSVEDLEKLSTYKDLDFENIWIAKEGNIPMLRGYYFHPDCAFHWAWYYIEKLSALDKISGYEDGTFRPDNTVTKAEFIKMINETTTQDIDVPYTDVPEWAMPYVKYAIYSELIDEHLTISDTLLGADKPITRLEAGVIVGRTTHQHWHKELEFTDADEIPDWAVQPLVDANLEGYDDGSFRPNNTLTRAEAVVMLSKNIYDKLFY